NERRFPLGRANTPDLALPGHIAPAPLTSHEMLETLKLCVSCKACRRECPTGVDMAKMKIEVLAARAAKHGLGLRDRLIAYLPHYAPVAARAGPLLNLRNHVPLLASMTERMTGFSARRKLPKWRRD